MISGRPEVIGDGTLRRTRANIRAWLLDWNGVTTNAARMLSWARLKAEIEIAVGHCDPELQDYWELSCVYGYTDRELCRCCRCAGAALTVQACEGYWRRLLREVTLSLCDSRIYEQPITGRGPIPLGRADYPVRWWERT